MTAEHVFKLYRAYKFYYDGVYDFKKYNGNPPPSPPLIKQYDRQFYYRIAQKMGDAQIHALFTAGFFFHPRAHASELVTTEAQKAALYFAGRAENGETLLQHDLYQLARPYQEPGDDKHALLANWLYGDEPGSMPECLQQVISGALPLDIACLLLLIPQPALHYNWPSFFASTADTGLGPHPWINRLKKVDQLLNMQRSGWRVLTHRLANEFWTGLNISTLAPPHSNNPNPSIF